MSMSRFSITGLFGGICGLMPIVLASSPTFAQENVPEIEPITVAESSDFQATSTSAEVEEFISECVELGEHVTSAEYGKTGEGRPMTFAIVADPPYDVEAPDERLVALWLGNIHSGECSGKEALLMLLRELAHDPDHRWLSKMVILVAPNYNADGNDQMAVGNRRGQVGPARGMGRRHNSQGLDLNRDFMKIESPEAQALVGLMNRWDPDLFIDCHTTNGSRHRYCLTYDIPHNPTAPQDIASYMRRTMMPTVTQRLQEQGKETFYYGNFNRDRTAWYTYGYEPRYSTEYGGLRGCLAVLSEAYSYITYKERIKATHAFVAACTDFVFENAEVIRQLRTTSQARYLEAAGREDREQRSLMLSQEAEVAAFEEPYTILGFDEEDQEKPADIEVRFFGRYNVTKQRSLPHAYLFAPEQTEIVQKLRTHGISVEQLEEATNATVEVCVASDITKARRAFQGHEMVTYRGVLEQVKRELPKGTIVVRTAQPLGRLAGYLLDPESNDSFTTWNYFDEQIEVGEAHPIMATVGPIEFRTGPLTVNE